MRIGRTTAAALMALGTLATPLARVLAGPNSTERRQQALGRELFERMWVPNDARCHGGDGLGPVFNARSCVECHHQGGTGGGGPSTHDVEIITPVLAGDPPKDAAKLRFLVKTVKYHTGLRSMGSSVLHRFGTNPDFAEWRTGLLAKQFHSFSLSKTRRNTPALFGAGVIDRIPDQAIEANAARTFPEFPKVSGRVSRLKDGRIGRFGWKGHTASLKDFVLTACSVELGLEVPGHHQASNPSLPPDRHDPSLDLNAAECDALVAFVASLPAPAALESPSGRQSELVSAGSSLFKSIGCATCHSPEVGNVKEIYSDLLLHDLGRESADSVAYYTPSDPVPDSPMIAKADTPANPAEPPPGPKPVEWRTTPLWGMRDSAPYLHDGRASTLDDIVAAHGGEASEIRERYRSLPFKQRLALKAFLNSLAAPSGAEQPRRVALAH